MELSQNYLAMPVGTLKALYPKYAPENLHENVTERQGWKEAKQETTNAPPQGSINKLGSMRKNCKGRVPHRTCSNGFRGQS